MDRLPRYRTGDPGLDRAVAELVELSEPGDQGDLVFETVVSAIRMGRERVGRADLKLVNAALKELRYAFHVFEPYRDVRKCTIFGSARTRPDDPAYASARAFGAAMVAHDWMVMTGAGPGIMAAGLEGARPENSFGINIVLPFEASANEIIADDPKLINFRYFFTRKVTFMKETHGYALFPGGFGTMDEAFELLTLMQTGKSYLAPVVLIDPPGNTYWDTWREFVEHELLGAGLISAHDLDLVFITDSVDAAVDEICLFFRIYHSMRFVGSRLVIRLSEEIAAADLAELNREFADIVSEGTIDKIDATQSEIDDGDALDKDRIAFRFDRASYSRLRQMVRRINDLA
ncbi:MAG: LOG family protein [Acidimicrobiia bacterium]|nr:LOG family protein [Acidimicrobiia bacterium]